MNAGCCRDPSKLEVRSALAGFQFLPQPDLIGWNVRCPVGVGGPAVTKNAEVRFHYLQLYEKDARTLMFALVPGWITFDAGGNKANDVIQGCPDVSGLAALKE